ncbi:MAG: aldo/keto reductase [Hellea sp.]
MTKTPRVELSKELDVSRLIYGMWRLCDGQDTSPRHIQAKLEACLGQGITTIDQADIYGGYGAEELLGTCLKQAPSLRDSIEIITKCGIIAPVGRYADRHIKHYDTGRQHIVSSVETSLRLMGIEQVDLLLIHRPDPFMNHLETGAALDELVASGKVRALGVSNFKPFDWNLLQSAMSNPLVTNQIELSVMETQSFVNGDIAHLQQLGVHPMAWSPLSGGALFTNQESALRIALNKIACRDGVDIAAVAIAWLLAHPSETLPVIGTNKIQRIKSLGDAFRVSMDRETWFEIYTASLGTEVP